MSTNQTNAATRSEENTKAAVPEWLAKLNAEAKRRYDAVDWQQGKWYAIYDERDGSPASAQLFQCEIDSEGVVYLVADQCEYDRAGGYEPDVYEALGYITSGAVVVSQS